MAIPQSIRKRGFRKWYERELLVGHSHLLLLLLCTLAFIGGLEAFGERGAQRMLIVVSLLAAVAIGAWALRRYLFVLMRAELIANQAVCPQCKSYARWQVDDQQAGSGAADDDADGPAEGDEVMTVRCRKCSHRWPIRW